MSRLRGARLSAPINTRATEIAIKWPVAVPVCGAGRPFQNFRTRTPATTIRRISIGGRRSRRHTACQSGSRRQVLDFRFRVDHSSGNRFINRMSRFVTKRSARHSSHSAPINIARVQTPSGLATFTFASVTSTASVAAITSVTVASTARITSVAIASAAITSSATIMRMVASILSRIWIALVVRQWIPADIVAK